jgi:hypothetical protein
MAYPHLLNRSEVSGQETLLDLPGRTGLYRRTGLKEKLIVLEY